VADSAVPITAGSGTNIDTYAITGGDHQQIVREAKATATGNPNAWTPATTASTAQVAADASRVAMLMVNNSNVRVYIRFDSTAPTSSSFHWFLDAGDRWEVPLWWVTLAVSMLGASTGTGSFLTTLATAA
jgi:hypothetical protein